MSCAYAEEIKINDAKFKIPEKYTGGDAGDDSYRLDNTFSIRCIDDNVPGAIGLWAEEHEYVNDTNINNHPVRHYCQYNTYVDGNHSHAYFVSGKSLYEIAWTGSEITKDIKSLIKNTPKSQINDDDFYNALDESYNIYKQDKIDKLNKDGEYNYMEAKYNSQHTAEKEDNKRFKEILLMNL